MSAMHLPFVGEPISRWEAVRRTWARMWAIRHKWSYFAGYAQLLAEETAASIEPIYSREYPRPLVGYRVSFSSYRWREKLPPARDFSAMEAALAWAEDIVYAFEPRPWWWMP